jgi:hypothetical protein
MSTNESKGRPTPKRKEVESKRKVSSLAPIVTKDQKRASKALSKQDRMAQRAAYLRGDEAALPLRDRGPTRAPLKTLTVTPGVRTQLNESKI